MLKKAKRILLSTCKNAGAFQLLGNSKWRNQRLLILSYHGISIKDEHQWNPALYMRRSDFEARLRLLKRHGCSVLPLDEALQLLHTGALPPKSVALTFDDGYYDFYKQAFPLLRSYSFPATVYLTTYYCLNKLPSFYLICSYILWKKRGSVFTPPPDTHIRGELDLRTPKSIDGALSNIMNFAEGQNLSEVERNKLAEKLANGLGVDYGEILSRRMLHLMNADEVRQLAAGGVDFQLHSHCHISPLEESAFRSDLNQNLVAIMELAGSRPLHFCYPSGFYIQKYTRWLKRADIISATTCNPGLATKHSNLFLLPRVVDHSGLSLVEFESWLTGFSSFMPRRPAWRAVNDCLYMIRRKLSLLDSGSEGLSAVTERQPLE